MCDVLCCNNYQLADQSDFFSVKSMYKYMQQLQNMTVQYFS